MFSQWSESVLWRVHFKICSLCTAAPSLKKNRGRGGSTQAKDMHIAMIFDVSFLADLFIFKVIS